MGLAMEERGLSGLPTLRTASAPRPTGLGYRRPTPPFGAQKHASFVM